VLAVAQILLGLWMADMHGQEVDQRLNRDLARSLVAETTILEDGEIRQENLEHIFHMLMVINPRIEVYLLDPEGQILAFSAPEGRVTRQRVDLRPVQRFLRGEETFPLQGDDPRDVSRKKIFSAAPIAPQGQVEGYLYVVLSGEEYDSVADRLERSHILRLGAWTGATALGLALVAGLLLVRLLTRRLERLDTRMQAFGQEALAGRTGVVATGEGVAIPAAGDEIDRLEETFSRMTERIATQVEELRLADESRRELVASVSHDLRTPLAALQGYLETLLLKNGSLGEEERHEYAEIAFKHSEQLSRLVGDLFELATLEGRHDPIETEVFSIAELTQDVVQKFRLEAERRSLRLELDLPPSVPFVRGDIGLIERALGNLLQNALRHTPTGGRVTVGLRRDGERIVVRVEDTGSGIPPEELPRIFDRFYRGRNADARSGGAGLGLAIAKRILELHGGDLRVESALGLGSSFFFALAPAGG
jgi:two-component system OmpR family sensor kinase